MDPILGEFGSEVARVRRQPPQIPIVSSMTGQLGTDEDWMSPTYWSAQLRRPVRFADAMGALLVDTSRVFLEVGPGNTLTALARQHLAWQQTRVAVPSLSRKSDDGLLPAMGELWKAGVPMKWDMLHSGPRRVQLPTYPFQRQRYWIERATTASTPEVPVPLADIPVRTDAAAIEQLINEQMRIMARQLEVLRAVPANGKHS